MAYLQGVVYSYFDCRLLPLPFTTEGKSFMGNNIEIRKFFAKKDLFSIGCSMSDCDLENYNQDVLKDNIEQYLFVLSMRALLSANDTVCPEGTRNVCIMAGESAIYQYIGVLLNTKATARDFAKDFNRIGDFLVTNYPPYPDNNPVPIEDVVHCFQGIDMSLVSELEKFACNIIVLPECANEEAEACELFMPQKTKTNNFVYNIVVHTSVEGAVDFNNLRKSLASAIATAILDYYLRAGGEEWDEITRLLIRAYDIMPGNETYHTDILFRKDDPFYKKNKNISYYPSYIPLAANLCYMTNIDIGAVASKNAEKARKLIGCFFAYKMRIQELLK